MGQSLMKFTSGLIMPNPTYKARAVEMDRLFSMFFKEIEEIAPQHRNEAKEKEIISTLEECYDKYFSDNTKKWNFDDFYQAISMTIQEINRKFINSTQFRVPDREKLELVYNNHFHGKQTAVKKEEFEKMLSEVILKSGVTGFDSIRELFLFIFGIPAAALFIKQGIAPKALSNDVFIPTVTSATVFLLAKLHKL